MISSQQSTNRNHSKSTQQISKFPSKSITSNNSTVSELTTKSNIEKFYQTSRNQVNFPKNQSKTKCKRTVSKGPYQGLKNEYFFNLAMINLNKYQDDILVRNTNDNNSIYDLKNFINEFKHSKNYTNNILNYCYINPNNNNKNIKAENYPTQFYNRAQSNLYINNDSTLNINNKAGNLNTETKNTNKKKDTKLIFILNKLELFDLIEVFKYNCISFEDLFLLTKEDLYEMNIPIGPRNRLINFLEQYKKYAKTYNFQEINSFLRIYNNTYNTNNSINKVNKNYSNQNYNNNFCESKISLNEKTTPKDNKYKQINTTSSNIFMGNDTLDSRQELPGKRLFISDLRGDNMIDIHVTPKTTPKNAKIIKKNINYINNSKPKSSYKIKNNNYLQNAIDIEDSNKIVNTEFSNCNRINNINNISKSNFESEIGQNQISKIKIDNSSNNDYLSIKTDVSPSSFSKESIFQKNNNESRIKNNINNENRKKIYQNYQNLFSEVNNFQNNYEKIKKENQKLDNKINSLLKTKSHSNLSYLRQKVIKSEYFNEEDLNNESVRDLNQELQKMNYITGNNKSKQYNNSFKNYCEVQKYQKNYNNPLIEQFNCHN